MSSESDRLRDALADRYTLERELGSGGMATVYLAHDLKHDRQVAVKVLLPELAAIVGAERFLNEIRVTANLQHPHILPLHDSGEAEGFLFYVMPYVEGESLRARLDRETQLPVGEAVSIAKAVAGALDHAHRHGVIHRDIKPENILLQDGEPVVADFGIALAVSTAGGGRLTETGLSLGTPYYMSPEQATADRDPGPESDVYSLACVLYEMIAGDPPHTGSTAQAVLARILTDRARPLTEIRETVPANVAAVVDRALAKLPADRFESGAAFAAALDDPGFTYAAAARAAEAGAGAVPTGEPSVAVPTPAARPRERFATFVPWGVAAVAVALALWGWFGPAPPAPPAAATTRVDLALDEPTAGFGRRVAISPDGRWIAYVGGASAVSTQLFVRRADQPDVYALPGTEGASAPDFSPDGTWIVFNTREGLAKVPVEGGPVLVLHPATRMRSDPSWGRDGFAYFGGGPSRTRGLFRVPETGGEAETLLETGEDLRHPVPLPDGSGVLFTAFRSLGDADVRLLDLETREARTLLSPGVHARYVPSGHLVYGHVSGTLMAVPFDLGRHEVTGSPAPVLPEVAVSAVSGTTQFAVSDGGTAVYLAGASLGGLRLALVGVAGEVDLLPVTAAPGQPAPRFSPDGRRIAFEDQGQIHTFDLELGTNAPLTFEGRSRYPVWSRDGRFLVFRGSGGMMSVAADGSAPPEPLTTPAIEGNPEAWSRDGTQLLYRNPADLYVLTLGDSISSAPYLEGEWNEYAAAVSPDGRFAAYASNESGAFEVYVRSFPTPGARYPVSVGGGGEPVWAPDGSRIYYRQGDALLATRVALEPDFRVLGRETVLSDLSGFARWEFSASYDVHPDGDRFVFFRTSGDAAAGGDAALTIVTHWFEELRERVGN
jgi:serine/threonine-protein kinase